MLGSFSVFGKNDVGQDQTKDYPDMVRVFFLDIGAEVFFLRYLMLG